MTILRKTEGAIDSALSVRNFCANYRLHCFYSDRVHFGHSISRSIDFQLQQGVETLQTESDVEIGRKRTALT